ncbi:hypothetical protein OVN20_05335 [Microcella daejeonensis]|uniref:hypothetical protein n=1 Tax=Microcella daejeonensis TaxID=2994971 RepID=UPI00226E40CE|nr:hypothetical protein [Microcella daejeonensis]WAB84975.1 hypothetical protein OVN20_05335 [Microcella daejeonensis]
MVMDTWVVYAIGFAAIPVLAVAGYWCVARFAPRRWRRPWLAVAAIIVASAGVVALIDESLQAPRAMESLNVNPGLPATYTTDESSFTLDEDGSATLTNVVLADDFSRNDEGRRCISGEPVSISGDARWTMTRDGEVRIEARGKESLLVPDPTTILGYGWGKGYLFATCDLSVPTEYLASYR